MFMETETDGSSQRFAPLAFFGIVVLVALIVKFGIPYIEHRAPQSPQDRIDTALREFRSGHGEAALSLLSPLAAEGNPKAQYWLADIYENGRDVKLDPAAAHVLLEKSATQGFVQAEEQLGELYLRGTETFQDFAKAQTWLHSAATAGNAVAQRELGRMYALGTGVSADLPQAYGWYENAVINGDRMAEHLRDDLLARMSSADIAKGEQAAKEIAATIKPAKGTSLS